MKKALNTSELANLIDIKGSNTSPQENIVKIVVTNDANGTPNRESLGNFETNMKKLADVCQQASNSMAYFSTNLKSINSKTGLATQEFFIQASEAENVRASMEKKAKSLFGANLNVSNERPVLYSISDITLHGKKAQTRARAEIADVAGGQIIPAGTKKNPDRFKVLLPLPDGVLPSDRAWTNARKKTVFSESLKFSADEKKKRDIEAEEAKTAREILEIKKQYKEVERARLENARAIQKMEADDAREKASVEKQVAQYFADEEAQKKKDEEKKRKEAEDREKYEKDFEQNWLDVEATSAYDEWEKTDSNASLKMREEKKRISESARKTAGVLQAIITGITILVDIARRILTATLKNASKIDKDTVEAQNMGMSYLDKRSMDLFDKAHGLPEGTTFKAVQTTQQMFGDVTNIDDKALGILARVMGGKVSELVQSGLGSADPQQFTADIIDAYFKQWKAGKNSLGQSVGKEQAEMEMYQSLNSVSPEYANLFARMVSDYNSGNYKSFENYAEWRNTTETNRTGLSKADTDMASQVGKKYDEILAIVEDLKNSFLTKLSASLDDLLEQIRNIRFGMDVEKSLELDRSNYAQNEITRKQIRSSISAYNTSSKDRLEEINEIIPATNNPTTDSRFHFTAETLAGVLSGDIDEKYLKSNIITGSGMISQDSKEIEAYLARARIVAKSAMLDPEVNDEIVRIMVANEKLKAIDEQQKKGIGGNVALVDYSLAEETALAEKKFKDVSLYVGQAYGGVQSPIAQEVLKKAYIQYLYDNPTEYEALLYDLFGTSEDGSQITANGIAIDLARKNNDNVADVGGISGDSRRYKKAQIQAILKEEFARRKAKYLKDNNKESLSLDEEKAIYMSIIADYNGVYFENRNSKVLSGETKNQAKWIIGATESEYIQDLSNSDSMILGALIRSVKDLANGSYNYSGNRSESGEYVLTIVGKDDKTGNTVKQSISLGRTEGQEVAGTFIMTDGGFKFTEASMSE